MARFLILLVALVPLAACGSSSAQSTAGAARARCGPAGGQTLASSSSARAYSYHGAVYGCAGTHQYRLGRSDRCLGTTGVGPVTVTARLVAYAARSCGIDTSTSQVVVRRLSDGKQLAAYPASSLTLGAESFSTVGSIVVDRSGHVAWIVSMSSIGTHRHGVQVLTSGRTQARVLDSSRNVDPHSLRRNGSKVTWTDGGSKRSATLGPAAA